MKGSHLRSGCLLCLLAPATVPTLCLPSGFIGMFRKVNLKPAQLHKQKSQLLSVSLNPNCF
jgi:hypothetical protein